MPKLGLCHSSETGFWREGGGHGHLYHRSMIVGTLAHQKTLCLALLIITRPCLGVFEFNFNFKITSYNNPSDGRLQIALILPLLVLALLKKSRQFILRRSTSWGDLCFELNIFLWDPALKKDPIYTCTCTWVEKCLPFKYMKLFHVQKSSGLHVNIFFHTKWATVSFYLFLVTYILTQKHLHIFELHNIII